MASERRESATLTARSRLPDAISLSYYYSTGLKTRGYSPFGPRVFQTPLSSELWVMSNERRVTSNEERKKCLQRRGYKALRHAELVSASHCEPLLTPFTRWDPEICDLARAEPNLLELCRAWANWTKLNKFRMTLCASSIPSTSCWTRFSISPRAITNPVLGEILKQVIRLRSSKTSFIFEWGMVRMTLCATSSETGMALIDVLLSE